mmetsp:Transcript_16823/g.48479  ORF Transcript_16823/g.48479 Transcript_16823/m.48479 type:complete len:348 (+) Transcript_16823:332-1375(+)
MISSHVHRIIPEPVQQCWHVSLQSASNSSWQPLGLGEQLNVVKHVRQGMGPLIGSLGVVRLTYVPPAKVGHGRPNAKGRYAGNGAIRHYQPGKGGGHGFIPAISQAHFGRRKLLRQEIAQAVRNLLAGPAHRSPPSRSASILRLIVKGVGDDPDGPRRVRIYPPRVGRIFHKAEGGVFGPHQILAAKVNRRIVHLDVGDEGRIVALRGGQLHDVRTLVPSRPEPLFRPGLAGMALVGDADQGDGHPTEVVLDVGGHLRKLELVARVQQFRRSLRRRRMRVGEGAIPVAAAAPSNGKVAIQPRKDMVRLILLGVRTAEHHVRSFLYGLKSHGIHGGDPVPLTAVGVEE